MMCYIIGVIIYWTNTREVVTIKKSLDLKAPINGKQKKIIYDLNNIVGDMVHFSIVDEKLNILVYEEKLKVKAGRPVEHEFDYNTILKMQEAGETNKAIYTKLGMSKSLFYLKMREYKNNNGH